MKKAVRLHPHEQAHYIDLAHRAMRRQSFELGPRILNDAADRIPDSSRSSHMRRILNAELGRYDEAETAFERARAVEEIRRAATTALAMKMEKRGNLGAALDLIRSEVRENPDDPRFQRRLAEVLVQWGTAPGGPEFEEARLALERSVEMQPDDPSSWIQLGRLLIKPGQMPDAIHQLQRAVEIDPTNQRASYQLFLALRKTGRRAEAGELMERFQKLLERERQQDEERPRYHLIETPIRASR